MVSLLIFSSLHARKLEVIQCCEVGKKEEEIIEKWRPSDRLWTCGILWILITKKDHDDGNHYFNILKTTMFSWLVSVRKGLIQVGTHFVHGGSLQLRITERSIRALVPVVQK